MNWEALAKHCGFLLLGQPRRLSGGFLHQMFALETDQGRYAVKLLNPTIMRRSGVMDNYRRAEALEKRLEEVGIPIEPALTVHGSKMQEINGQFFYLFAFFDGHVCAPEDVTPLHCEAVGQALAAIHAVARRIDRCALVSPVVDWRAYQEALRMANHPLCGVWTEALPLLERLQQRAVEAMGKLSPVRAICHGDMDSKNVLWQGSTLRIIDLECLDWGHPEMELMQQALCWSGWENGSLCFALMDAFLKGYRMGGGVMPASWDAPYDANTAMLEWLAYNLRRALGMEGAPEEQALGQQQCRFALSLLQKQDAMRDEVLRHCAAL